MSWVPYKVFVPWGSAGFQRRRYRVTIPSAREAPEYLKLYAERYPWITLHVTEHEFRETYMCIDRLIFQLGGKPVKEVSPSLDTTHSFELEFDKVVVLGYGCNYELRYPDHHIPLILEPV